MEWIKHVWSFFIRGGVIMWPLLLCSLSSLTIILERWPTPFARVSANNCRTTSN